MNDFDFSTYDFDAPTEEIPKKSKKLSIGEPPMKTHEMFDWDQFPDEQNSVREISDEEEESLPKSIARTALQVPLGISQAITYPLDVIKLVGEGNALSDLDEILEKVPENEREQFRNKYLETLAGSSEYFPTQGNLESYIEEKTGLPLVPKTKIQKLIRLGASAGKFASGGAISKGSAAVTAPAVSASAQFAGAPESVADMLGLGVSQLPSMGAKSLKNRLPSSNAAAVESDIIGHDLPKNSFGINEQGLAELQIPAQRQNLPFNQVRPSGQERPLAGRGTEAPQQIPIRPTATTPLELEDQVSGIFSPNRYKNATEGGIANVQEIRNLDQQAYRGVQELYNRSRQLNEGIETYHPQLDSYVNDVIQNIERIPEPSDIQRRLLRAATNIRDSLSHRGLEGEVVAYLPINNQALIDQVQSLRSIVDYDFQHGGAKNIFRPLIGEIQESVLNGARQTGNLEAVAANQEARQAYAQWAQTFDNDYIRPFRDTSNHDYNKLFDSLKDPDKFNQVYHVLEISPRGKQLANANISSMVEDKLGKFLRNPKKANPRDFNQSLRDLESVAGINEDQISQVRNSFNQSKQSPQFRAVRPTTAEHSSAKYLKMKPEDIQNLLGSRSGIRQLRTDLGNTETGRKLYDVMTRQKMRSILRDGNIEKKFNGDDLYKFLNKEKNFELFSEIIGEEATEEARLAAKEIGKKQMIIEKTKKLAGKAGAAKFLNTIYPLLL